MYHNVFAVVIVMILGLAFYIAASLAFSAAWMTANWLLIAPVLLVMSNYVVKLTTWQGDDSLWDILRKAIEKKVKP